jgi:YfiR/HmsC-like
MLGLVPRGQRIVFDANPRAIQASGLQVSAKVLKLAHIVEPPP